MKNNELILEETEGALANYRNKPSSENFRRYQEILDIGAFQESSTRIIEMIPQTRDRKAIMPHLMLLQLHIAERTPCMSRVKVLASSQINGFLSSTDQLESSSQGIDHAKGVLNFALEGLVQEYKKKYTEK